MDLFLIGFFVIAFGIGVACMGMDVLDDIYYQRNTAPNSDFDSENTCVYCKSTFYVNYDRINQGYCSTLCEIYTQDLVGVALSLICKILYIGVCTFLGSILLIVGLWIIAALSNLNLSNVECLLWVIILMLFFKK